MKHSKNQGSALVIVIVLLSVLIVGGLGYVAWSNFFAPKPSESAVKSDAEQSNGVAQTDKTYSSEGIGISFKYPKDWVSLACDDKPRVVYFASDIRGIGNGNETLLCGGGSDFPPQMSFALIENYTGDFAGAEDLVIDGKAARKVVTVSDENSIYPKGFETTSYTIMLDDGKTVACTYSKWPQSDSASYDTSDETQQKFVELVEKSLKFT